MVGFRLIKIHGIARIKKFSPPRFKEFKALNRKSASREIDLAKYATASQVFACAEFAILRLGLYRSRKFCSWGPGRFDAAKRPNQLARTVRNIEAH